MAMKNKYAKRARISEAKIREIVRYVAADLTALQAAALSGAEPQHREPALPGRAGAHAAGLRSPAPAVWGRRGRRELLRGAPGQGPAGARRLRQDRRLRHLRAAGPRLYRDRLGLLKPTLQGIIRGRVDPRTVINSDGWRGYHGLVDLGYGHVRVDHARDEFTKGTVHINGIEGFWGLVKVRLTKFKGLPRHTFHLHLKETEWRYNHRRADKYKCLLQYLRKNQLS